MLSLISSNFSVFPVIHIALTNAISGISIVGALLGANVAYEGGDTVVSGILAFVALVLAMINVVGGFAVTNRMLNMIAGKKRGGQ